MTFKVRLGVATAVITVMLTCALIAVEVSEAPVLVEIIVFAFVGGLGFLLGTEIIREGVTDGR